MASGHHSTGTFRWSASFPTNLLSSLCSVGPAAVPSPRLWITLRAHRVLCGDDGDFKLGLSLVSFIRADTASRPSLRSAAPVPLGIHSRAGVGLPLNCCSDPSSLLESKPLTPATSLAGAVDARLLPWVMISSGGRNVEGPVGISFAIAFVWCIWEWGQGDVDGTKDGG